jgi:hypothetical protein
MFSLSDIIPCIEKLSYTETIILSYDVIQSCDEETVSPCKEGFIKKYYHFTYPTPGVLLCKVLKGHGVYIQEEMKQNGNAKGIIHCYY